MQEAGSRSEYRLGCPPSITNLHSRVFTPNVDTGIAGEGGRLASRDERERERVMRAARPGGSPGPSRSRSSRSMRCDAMRCDAMRGDVMRCDATGCGAMRDVASHLPRPLRRYPGRTATGSARSRRRDGSEANDEAGF